MAILNVTPDSFFAGSRIGDTDALRQAARRCIDEGAEILDIGGCSTRPDSTPVDEATEWRRVEPALELLRTEWPEMTLSLDTFRPEIARRAMERFGRMIINDVSGGNEAMYELVRAYNAPYVWTLRGDYSLPVRRPDVLAITAYIDPGLGFCGGVENDYRCISRLNELRTYGKPVLVGVSRKSMLYRPLGITPGECLSATQVLHLYALQHGADVLRVHDVKEAVQTIRLFRLLETAKC